jgi:hypothetical protein
MNATLVRNGMAVLMAMAATAGMTAFARGNASALPQEAQAQQGQPAPRPPKPIIPLKVTIVISRVQGEKKTASLPFTLSVNTNDQRTQLRMGADVPLPMTGVGPTASTPVSYSYKSIGTNIDCGADTLEDGRYRLLLTITDSQVFSDATNNAATTVRGVPSYQSFTTTTPVILRDGQSAQFTTATDKLSGELVKVDVTLNVIK